jgi:hypothetical protein
MSTFIRSAIVAVAVLSGLSAVQAQSYDLEDNARPASSYNLNSPDDVKSFWEQQDRNRGN